MSTIAAPIDPESFIGQCYSLIGGVVLNVPSIEEHVGTHK